VFWDLVWVVWRAGGGFGDSCVFVGLWVGGVLDCVGIFVVFCVILDFWCFVVWV